MGLGRRTGLPWWLRDEESSLSITSSQSPPKPLSINSTMPSNHLILCRPLLLPPSIFPSITVFSSESILHIRWSKYWSFSFRISPSNEYSGLIFFNGLVGSPCSPRDSQESSPTPQFKSISSSAFNLLYSPTLISIHDYWKNHSFQSQPLNSSPWCPEEALAVRKRNPPYLWIQVKA